MNLDIRSYLFHSKNSPSLHVKEAELRLRCVLRSGSKARTNTRDWLLLAYLSRHPERGIYIESGGRSKREGDGKTFPSCPDLPNRERCKRMQSYMGTL